MATFQYNGEPPQSGFVQTMGKSNALRFPLKDGTWLTLDPPVPATGWVSGNTFELTDERALRAARADTTRFTEL
jgi:hypothetical protein